MVNLLFFVIEIYPEKDNPIKGICQIKKPYVTVGGVYLLSLS